MILRHHESRSKRNYKREILGPSQNKWNPFLKSITISFVALFLLGALISPLLVLRNLHKFSSATKNEDTFEYVKNPKGEFSSYAALKTNEKKDVNVEKTKDPLLTGKAPGVIILGMHRSGTSMLCGLLVTGFKYHIGSKSKLLDAKPENPLGYFERKDVVFPSETILKKEVGGWNGDVTALSNTKLISEGTLLSYNLAKSALQFLNDRRNWPWVLKDPRLCVMLPTWLNHIKSELPPAIVFTYRDPLEVALSLSKRRSYKKVNITFWLKLWIEYNMLAIRFSENMCIVFTSSEEVVKRPYEEGTRIGDELRKCGAPPLQILQQTIANSFVDESLQHKKDNTDPLLEKYGECNIQAYESSLEEHTEEYIGEREMYLKAMRVYCDLKNGKAYKKDYVWPILK